MRMYRPSDNFILVHSNRTTVKYPCFANLCFLVLVTCVCVRTRASIYIYRHKITRRLDVDKRRQVSQFNFNNILKAKSSNSTSKFFPSFLKKSLRPIEIQLFTSHLFSCLETKIHVIKKNEMFARRLIFLKYRLNSGPTWIMFGNCHCISHILKVMFRVNL